MKKTTRKWIIFSVAVLVLFFISVCLLFLQINSSDTIIQSITFSKTAGVVVIGLEAHDRALDLKETHELPAASASQSQTWLVVYPDGVCVENRSVSGSSIVDHLPWGSIVTGNIIQMLSTEGISTRLFISFPCVGWVTLSEQPPNSSAQYYVQPLNTTYIPKVASIVTAVPPNTCSDPTAHLVHTDFKGGDLQAAQLGSQSNPVHTNSNAECCVQCCRTQYCVFWTRSEGGECWLKGPTAVRTPASGKNLVSGIAVTAGCVRKASADDKKASTADNSVEKYASSAMCFADNVTIRGTSICQYTDHPLYEPVLPDECVASQTSKLSVDKCRLYKYRPISHNQSRCEIKILESVHVLQRGQALSDAPTTTLLQPSLTVTDWGTQHPLGSGRFGALVGGNIRSEIIPVSVAGFYVRKARAEEAPGENAQPPPDASLFKQAREDLKDNNIKEADKKMSRFIKKNLATFQYLFDMAIVYSPVEMRWIEPDAANANVGKATSGKKAPPVRPRNLHLSMSRGALLRTIYDHIDYKLPDQSTGPVDASGGGAAASADINSKDSKKHGGKITRPPFGDVLVSDGILDMKYGVAYNSFVEHIGTSGTANPSIAAGGGRDNIGEGSANVINNDSKMNGVRLHHREWFASSEDNVMIGTISCRNTAIHNTNSNTDPNAKAPHIGSDNGIDDGLGTTACVHAALQLHRDNDLSLMPAVSIHAAPIDLDHTILNAWRLHTIYDTDESTDKQLDNNMSTKIKAFRFDVALVSTPDVTVPATAISGVVLCTQLINPGANKHNIPSNPPMSFTQHSYFDGSDPVLLCNHAHKMHIILSVESNGNIFDSPVPPAEGANDYSTADVSASLLKKAHTSVQKALQKGLIALKIDHMRRFNATMSKVDISLSSSSSGPSSIDKKEDTTSSSSNAQYHTSPVYNLQHRIESFNSGCLHSTTTANTTPTNNNNNNQDSDISITNLNTNIIDASLLSSLFQYGRYLLYSSGSNSMINLQGLWADGPTSAWNGDYHMNINVQMSYWAVDAVRVHEAMRPLNNFIQQLQTKGSIVARDMYGTTDPRGWVAHGFTDGYMDTSLYGDNQWALCVTCGAWAALQQWEQLLYAPSVGNTCGGIDTDRVGEEANIDEISSLLGTLRGVVLFFKEYMFRVDEHNHSGKREYTMHTGPTTSPENSYILLMTGEAADTSTAEQIPSRGHVGKHPHPAEPYSVHSLTFSPAIDVSVLRQVANAFTLSVQHAQHTLRKINLSKLREHCKYVKEGNILQTKFDSLEKGLVEDEKLAAEFTELVAHMPGGGLPVTDTTLHDPEHQVALHVAKAAQKTQLAAQQHDLLAQKNKESGEIDKSNNMNVGDNAHAGPAVNPVANAFREPLQLPPNAPDHARKLSAVFTPAVMELPPPLPNYELYIREYTHLYAHTTAGNSDASHTSHTNNQQNYPDGLQNAVAEKEQATSEILFSEDLDPGHRHFSGLHWLYPNTFLPYLPDYTSTSTTTQTEYAKTNSAVSKENQNDDYATLKRAAYNTLRTKTERGGGHTGWSAVWEAALYARLHQPTAALAALTKFVTRYLAPNLMCLHPPLDALNEVQCSTCFNESPGLTYDRQNKKDLHMRDAIKHMKAENSGEMMPVLTAQELNVLQDATLLPRGMVTAPPFSSKFQIDGNLGYLAALTEMLLQSHTPGVISLLPALPAALPSGHVYGLNARGNVIVSMAWRDNKLQASELYFQSDHFWLHSQDPINEYPGFYDIKKVDLQEDLVMVITAPNNLSIATSVRHSVNICQATLQLLREPNATDVSGLQPLQYTMRLVFTVLKFPCELRLCAHHHPREDTRHLRN